MEQRLYFLLHWNLRKKKDKKKEETEKNKDLFF